ncbi:MAG: hypothetical protein WCA17_00550 [Burkholderiales bacterium]
MSPNTSTLRHWIAIVLVAAWAPQGLLLWPTPSAVTPEYVRQEFRTGLELSKKYPDTEETRAARRAFQKLIDDPSPVIRHLWLSWAESLCLIGLGLIAALMAWRGTKGWRWLFLATALGYFWLYSWPSSLKPMWEYASSISEALDMLGVFFRSPGVAYTNFVTPVLLVFALFATILDVARSRQLRATSNPTVERDARKSGARPSL